MIAFPCPKCHATLKAPEEKAGAPSKCPHCGTPVRVPTATPVPPAQPHAPAMMPARTQVVGPLLVVGKWLAFLVAMGLALTAAVLPLTASTSELVNYGVAGVAILFGLAAVLLSIMARRSLLECAVTTVFLAVTALLAAINISVATHRANTAAETLAHAVAQEDEVRQVRERGEAAQKTASEMLKKAEEADARAEAAPEKAARLLEDVKAEQLKLDNKGKRLDEQSDALAAERARIAEAKAKLDDQAHAVEDEKKAAAALAKRAEDEKQAAADLAKKAEGDKLRAKETLEKAEQKEKEAQELQKKVKEAIDGVKGQVKSKQPQDRKAAIAALARLGKLAASADYELCEVITFDPVPELKKAALEALEKVQPKLYPLAVTLSLPPENSMSGGYIGALEQLPSFGRAGLPLIAAQVQSPTVGGVLLGMGDRHALLMAHIGALAAIADNDDAALDMLLALPESALAASGKAQAPGLHNSFCRAVGERAEAAAKAKPAARKVVVPYFIKLLASADAGSRQFAANALGSFGPDAKAALPALRQRQLDAAEQVRNAVRAAIANIERDNK